MAKAKFPGKPPKTSQITRLRVSSYSNGSSSDSSRLVAQQAAFGLKLFHQHFAADDEDDDDFVGFEKTAEGFKPHFQSGCLHTERFRRTCHEVKHKPREELIEAVVAVKVPPAAVVPTQHHTPSTAKQNIKVSNERIPSTVTQSSSASPCGSLKSSVESQPDKKNVEKHLKHVQASSKNTAFPKVLVPEEDAQIQRKGSSEDCERTRKPRPIIITKLQPPVGEESAEQEKNRIKREIARYTTIMTTEVVDSKQPSDEKKKSKKHNHAQKEGDKAEKLRDKIQQLLRKQWESRLQLVDAKVEPQIPLETKTEMTEGRGSSLSVSSASEEDDLFYKRRRMSSNSSSSSSARKSKIILRKARLQLNQKLLKQLRHPSRLQQLVEPKPFSVPTQTVPSSSSILRPAQLVLQTSSNPVPRIPAPRPMPVKEPRIQPKIPNPPSIKSSYIPKAAETTVSNPLGCAFVMGPSDSKGLPGTVVCGVCGAVRRYSFILQARKFGTFSCEPCRKFISRILRARVPVKCSSGSGHCIHPPVLRWNSACPPEDKPANGEVMTARCKACWLTLALTGFQMRESDHDELRKLLPVSMQDGIPLAADRPTTLHWAPNRGQMIRMKPNSSSIPNVPVLPTSVAAHIPKIKAKSASSKKAEHCPGSRTREKTGSGGGGSSSSSSGSSANNGSSSTETQSGPRVKHVCRSAVAVRAQPRATFHSEDSAHSESTQPNTACDCCSLTDPCSAKAIALEPLATANGSETVPSSNKVSRSTDRKNSLSSPAMPLTTSQGERFRVTFHDDVKLGPNHRVGLMTPAVRAWQQQENSRTKKNQFRCMTSGSTGRKPAKTLPKGLILADLWEHYDADRVWDQGFAICCSQLGVTSSLCFLCGSSGRNELVCCSSCCETFHPFCVADSAPLSSCVPSECHHWDKEAVAGRVQDKALELHVRERNERAVSVLSSPSTPGIPWICLNCVVCQICQTSSGERMVCSSCSHAYHWCCLGPAHPSSKRKRRIKWQCFACLPVQDKFCPLCFDYHTSQQMKMECNCCGSWVHAQCEELPEEDFRLLCTSNSIEFVCRLCCPDKIWLKALRRHANQIFMEILAKLIGLDVVSSNQIDAISCKVSQNEYLNCSGFSSDVRQLVDQSNGNQFDLVSLMPWIEAKKMPIAPLNQVSVAAKVDYDEKSDCRLCALCHGRGEGPASAEGRLLYCGNDIWTHINCALWSNEVFEEVDGALQNVFDALARGSGSRCTHCHTKGATVNCCVRGCLVSLHFPCALQPEPEVTLLEGKRLICRHHANEQQPSSDLVIHPPNFEVARCVYVDLGAESKRIKPCTPRDIRVVIGSLTVSSIGHLRSDVSGGATGLTPVGFECQRRFWSVQDPRKMASYTLRTIYVPSSSDRKDAETNVTVSHEEDDVIMAESGLNLAELDTQDDRELIHMVLEDANFEQELEGEPNASLSVGTPNELRDSGFYSDGRSAGEVSPSPTEDNALEAWLADPEHAVFFLDSALLASLDIDNPQPSVSKTGGHSATSVDDARHHQTGHNYPQSPELNSPPKRHLRNRRLSYSQWRKMRLQNRTNKRTMDLKSSVQALERPSTLDWNGNEAEWDNGATTSSNLVASIKVSPLSPPLKPINNEAAAWMPRRNKPPGNILQLDGAADSSDTEPEKSVVVKLEIMNEDEPVKCRRCRRSYRTLQSFNKHVDSCVEMLSISSSSGDSESDDDATARPVKPKHEQLENNNNSVDSIAPIPILLQPKEEPMDISPAMDEQEKEPIQVHVVNSSSSKLKSTPPVNPMKASAAPATSKTHPAAKSRVQRRKFRPNVNTIPARTLAIRQANPGGSIQFQMPTPSPIAPSYQVTIQSPTPPPITTAPLLYVTRPELTATHPTLQCSFLSQAPLTVPQQHYIIMPPSIDQTFIQATNCTVPTLSSSPMVQYLGAVPSNLLSALGIMTTGLGVTNYTTVPSLSALMQGQPLQVPWETPVSNQIVILPQPPLLSFNLPSVSLQSQLSPAVTTTTTITTTCPSPSPSPASSCPSARTHATTTCSTIELPAPSIPTVAAGEEPKQILEEKQIADVENDNICGKTGEPNSSTASLADRVDDSATATDNHTKTNSNAEKSLTEAKEAKGQILDDEEMVCEIGPPVKSGTLEDRQSDMEGKPPKPTYSYRSAMAGAGGKKTPRIIAPMGSEAKMDRPTVVQQLKVVAHPCSPDQATRTFHLKATTDNIDMSDQLSIEEDAVNLLLPACQMTRDTLPTTTTTTTTSSTTSTNADGVSADISDVFATPPASSEPPILPSDIDAEPVSWPVIDSTLEADEPTAAKPTVEIEEKKRDAHILYELVSDDGFYAQSESLSAVWQKLLDAVQDARLAFKMEPLYNGCLKSLDERNLHLAGLHHHAVINLLEQLPNANQLVDYTFRYQACKDRQLADAFDATGSSYGCVRAAPFEHRAPYDMFGWLASQYRPRPQLSAARAATDSSSDGSGQQQQQPTGGVSRRVTNFELLPMTVRFKHLRQVAKNSVGVFRSHIHGRGLFCKRDIESGEMVVEYAGQVIRSVLCDKREKQYEAKGMGCYMFRIDEQTVVDATVHGNAARFINHSCEPNCYSRIVDIFGKKHIIIFALRRIQRGEELTYDYKFPLEDTKIPCTCGSRKCRKYLN